MLQHVLQQRAGSGASLGRHLAPAASQHEPCDVSRSKDACMLHTDTVPTSTWAWAHGHGHADCCVVTRVYGTLSEAGLPLQERVHEQRPHSALTHAMLTTPSPPAVVLRPPPIMLPPRAPPHVVNPN